MKCHFCMEKLSQADAQKGRCPYCGNAVTMVQKRRLPVLAMVIIGLFMLVGAMIFLGGLGSCISYEANKAYYVRVDAQIAEILIEESYDSVNDETDIDYTVFVDYEYDGTRYEHVELGRHSSDMRVGDRLEIEIDTRDPGTVVSNVWWLMIVGAVWLAIVGGALYFIVKPKQKTAAQTLNF